MSPKNKHQNLARQIAAKLLELQPMRQGWVGQRRMKCGKKNCPCQHDKKARHGPYFTLTTPGQGKAKTKTQYLTEKAAHIARQQIEAQKEFRRQIKELMAAAQRWADDELQAAQNAAAKKKGFKEN